ncbi:YSC84-related protein [Niveibacterium umoris]|uniref:Lipid-binding SYLF domain-containing protein n=1 Tax=Niveibacterium umoris TaxID=1193620 RepID=A0A840BKM1_9RHOO|nr:hypothetical protein [Niveibacterium umoris]MBB4014111.1 lipid-binding SYLF domain-containing protein [Niveibacterium umoris]
MRSRSIGLALLLLLGLAPAFAHAEMSPKEKEKERATIRKDVKSTLNRLYRSQPSSKSTIAGAAGYAVLNNFGMKILVAGGGSGKGIAYDKSGKEVFLKMVEVQAGLGMGVKKFSQVWVFRDEDKLRKFMSGSFETSGQANATAKYKRSGGAYAGAFAVADGVWIYQLQGDGLALELTAKATKYYRYDELN